MEPSYLVNNLFNDKYIIFNLNDSYLLKGQRGYLEFQGLKSLV